MSSDFRTDLWGFQPKIGRASVSPNPSVRESNFSQQRCTFDPGGALGRGQLLLQKEARQIQPTNPKPPPKSQSFHSYGLSRSNFSSANILIHCCQLTEKDADHNKPRVPGRNASDLSDSSKSSYDLFTSLFDSVHYQSRCRVYF